jgi:threonine dehydrogenase-like Zn-dependent dehydrogenase
MQCNHFNIGALMECGIKLHGNGQAPVQRYWKELLRYIQEDKIHPLDMVTHRFKLEDMEKVYDLFDKREPGMQKVFIQTKFSASPSPGSPPLTVI